MRRSTVAAAALVLVGAAVVAATAARWAARIEPARRAPGGGTSGIDPLAGPGPFGAGRREITVTAPGGDDFGALLFYPAAGDGLGASYDGSGAPYPAVAFGHGFVQTPDRYHGTLEHLATCGYFVVAPASHAALAPDHRAFADDLSRALAWLTAQDGDASSWLAGQVATFHLGACGHSMGGGASLLAAASDPVIRAVASLAAADTRPSALQTIGEIGVPLAFIVGSEDGIVPASSTFELYRGARAPKQFATIQGGSHCGFQDEPFPIGCDRGSLPREEQLAITRARLTAFFGLYLKGDAALASAVWDAPTDPRVTLTAERGDWHGSLVLLPHLLGSE